MNNLSTIPNKLLTTELFAPDHTAAWTYLSQFTRPWEALSGVGEFIAKLGQTLSPDDYDSPAKGVWIHKTAVVAPSVFLGAGIIVCAGAQLRHCAFIRENALIGEGAVVGNSTELKNVILFDGVQCPHYNYVGDSILGYKSHLGAGAITSNVKSDRTPVSVSCDISRFDTGLKKFGAILGDGVEVGCNSVLNPGTVIGPGASVYPLSSVRGFVPAGCIYKRQGEVVERIAR